MQICPWCRRRRSWPPPPRASRSASASTTSGALPPSSSRTRLRCRAGFSAIDPPDASRAREVDPPNGRMGDQLIDDVGRVLRRVRDQVDHTRRKTGIVQSLDDRSRACAGSAPRPSAPPCCRTPAAQRQRARRGSPARSTARCRRRRRPAGARRVARLPGICDGISCVFPRRRVGLARVIGQHPGRELAR